MGSSTRYLLSLTLAVVFTSIAVSSSPYAEDYHYPPTLPPRPSHHLIIGTRQPGDQIVLRANVFKRSQYLHVVTYQQTYFISQFFNITQVCALDQMTNYNGAAAKLISGGPPLHNVTLNFKSLKSRGINFVVEVYAKPRY